MAAVFLELRMRRTRLLRLAGLAAHDLADVRSGRRVAPRGPCARRASADRKMMRVSDGSVLAALLRVTGDRGNEHTDQLGFYLMGMDAQMKDERDNPTIGLLPYKSKNRVVEVRFRYGRIYRTFLPSLTGYRQRATSLATSDYAAFRTASLPILDRIST